MQLILNGILGILHVLSAVAWVGGIVYHQVAVKPALKILDRSEAKAVNLSAARKFSIFTWASFILLAITGFSAVYQHREALFPITAELAGLVLAFKLLLVAVLFTIFIVQAYSFSPRIRALMQRAGEDNRQSLVNQVTRRFNTTWVYYALTGMAVIILSVILSGLLR
ncbi:MAG: hypothetical protein H0Z39_11010 [Peptococcaceae bacterium]|nr:hypothetical protein [Peptococcaceae bacterium]